jgi:flagellum-specific peptidoglycan hydrolase FlgJ
MGANQVSAAKMAAWYRANTSVTYRATVSVDTLARYFAEEGADEGIRGDLAFVQAVLETGWFGFGGSVSPASNNFAGIGATDSGGAPATFPDARTGVRAQIQHLRAYADPGVTTSGLSHTVVDPRFDLVSPKGRAPLWNDMGNGNWATDPNYASKIISLYNRMRAYAGLAPV